MAGGEHVKTAKGEERGRGNDNLAWSIRKTTSIFCALFVKEGGERGAVFEKPKEGKVIWSLGPTRIDEGYHSCGGALT